VTALERILGSNPLAGTYHFNPERIRTQPGRYAESHILGVMEEAWDAGAESVTFTSGDRVNACLPRFWEQERDGLTSVYPIIPNTSVVPRLLNNGTAGLVSGVLRDLSPSSKLRAAIGGGWAYLTSDPFRALRVAVRVEVERFSRDFPSRIRTNAVLLHELVTDSLLALGASALVHEYIDVLNSDLGIEPGFVTRNLPRLLAFFRDSRIDLRRVRVMAPLNPIGFQMAPDRHAVESALASATGARIIAISVLAGGRVDMKSGIEYVRRLQSVTGISIGVATRSHARETFGYLKRSGSLELGAGESPADTDSRVQSPRE
jgi:hypothetical protein